MPKKRTSPTFKDLLNQPTWSETGESNQGAHAVRPGKFNHAGDFFDPTGAKLVRKRTELSPAHAQQLVADGALLAFEGCGCGGWAGCAPAWASDEQIDQLRTGPKPQFVKGFGAPTWIDLWSSGTLNVVFAHGDVEWGSISDTWSA